MASKKIYPESNRAIDRACKLKDSIRCARGRNGTEYRVYALIDKEAHKQGDIAIRWTDCSEGIRCTTSILLWGKMADGEDAPCLAHTVYCQGYGYDMEGCNMKDILRDLTPWLEKRGFKLPDPESKDYFSILENKWRDIFKRAGYNVSCII